jgi:hypothetical protein
MAGNRTYQYILDLKDKMSKTMEKVSKKGNKSYQRLHRAQTKLNNLSSKFAPITKRSMAIAGGAAVAAAGKLVHVADQTAKAAAEQHQLAQRLGVSTREFTELSYAAGQFNVRGEALRDGIKEMEMRVHEFVTEGKGPAVEMLKTLGFSSQDLAKNLNDPMELFEQLRGRIAQVDNASKRQRIADELFGGQGGEQLVQFLGISSERLAELRKEGRETGETFGGKTGKQMVQYQQQMKQLQGVIKGLKLTFSKELIPIISKYARKLGDWIQKNRELIATKIKSFVMGVANAIKWLFENANWLIPVLKGVVGVMVALKVVTIAMNIAMMSGPWGWLIAAISGVIIGIIALIKNWDKVKAAMKAALDWVVNVFKGVWNWIKGLGEKIGQFFKMLWYKVTGQKDKAQEAKMKMKGIKLGEQFQKGFNKGQNKEQQKNKPKKQFKLGEFASQMPGGQDAEKQQKISKKYGGQVSQEISASQQETETAKGISAGGRKQTNINISLSNLVNELNISQEGFDTAVEDMEEQVTSALLRALNSANQTANG